MELSASNFGRAYVVEAVALVMATRLWINAPWGQVLIPVVCGNLWRAWDSHLAAAAAAEIIWRFYGQVGAMCYLRYVPSGENNCDGVSCLNPNHIRVLLCTSWRQVRVSDDLCCLFESLDNFRWGLASSGLSLASGSQQNHRSMTRSFVSFVNCLVSAFYLQSLRH